MREHRLTFAILIALLAIQTATSMKQLKKTHMISVTKNTFHTFDVRDGRLLYAKCKANTSSNKKECLVVGEKTLGRSDTYSCNVTLNALRQKMYVAAQVSVMRFGSNKAILVWQETDVDYQVQHLTISVLRLPSCRIADVKLDRETSFYEVFIIPYENTFDVFFKHSKVCGDNMCRIIVNSRGRVIWGPISYFEDPEEPYLLTSIDEKSSDRGYFYVKRSAGETLYLLIKPNCSQMLFAKTKGYPEITVSTAHNAISACASFNNAKGSINCTQFDNFGKLKFETTVDKPSAKAQMLFVHNPRRGGLLLGYGLASDCDDDDDDDCGLRNYLEKFDVDGEKVGSRIERNSDGKWASIFENEEGDSCLFKSFDLSSSLSDVGRHRMRIAHQCLSDTDFS